MFQGNFVDKWFPYLTLGLFIIYSLWLHADEFLQYILQRDEQQDLLTFTAALIKTVIITNGGVIAVFILSQFRTINSYMYDAKLYYSNIWFDSSNIIQGSVAFFVIFYSSKVTYVLTCLGAIIAVYVFANNTQGEYSKLKGDDSVIRNIATPFDFASTTVADRAGVNRNDLASKDGKEKSSTFTITEVFFQLIKFLSDLIIYESPEQQSRSIFRSQSSSNEYNNSRNGDKDDNSNNIIHRNSSNNSSTFIPFERKDSSTSISRRSTSRIRSTQDVFKTVNQGNFGSTAQRSTIPMNADPRPAAYHNSSYEPYQHYNDDNDSFNHSNEASRTSTLSSFSSRNSSIATDPANISNVTNHNKSYELQNEIISNFRPFNAFPTNTNSHNAPSDSQPSEINFSRKSSTTQTAPPRKYLFSVAYDPSKRYNSNNRSDIRRPLSEKPFNEENGSKRHLFDVFPANNASSKFESIARKSSVENSDSVDMRKSENPNLNNYTSIVYNKRRVPYDIYEYYSKFKDGQPDNDVCYSRNGLRFNRISELLDGNCLFRALARAQYRSFEYYHDMRQEIVDYIFSHAHELSNGYDDSITEIDNDYIINMRRDRIHGTSIEIKAFANLYNFVVVVQHGVVSSVEEIDDVASWDALFRRSNVGTLDFPRHHKVPCSPPNQGGYWADYSVYSPSRGVSSSTRYLFLELQPNHYNTLMPSPYLSRGRITPVPYY